MKQNSSILFHAMPKSLKNRFSRQVVVTGIAAVLLISSHDFLIAAPKEQATSFDSAKGFKPAQRDLTEIFLQLAGSLEFYGSPEPYVRHVIAEHKRIEALYRQKSGREPKSFRPDYMTDEYIDKFCANWKLLSPQLALDTYAKEFGRLMHNAIRGTRGNGTMLIEILNQHQSLVFDEMAGKGKALSDFKALRSELVRRLELDKAVVDENRYEITRRDAVSYAIIIHGMTMKLFARLDAGLKPADATNVKSVITGIIMETGRAAQSELQAGISEWGFRKLAE